MRARLRLVVALVAAVAAMGFSPRSSSTVLIIQVGDAGSGAFIADAQVRLPSVGRITRTRWDGEARFDGLSSGRYRVQVRALGFAPGDVDMQVSGDSAAVMFNLERIASLDTLHVVAEQGTAHGLREFEDRRKTGLGRFFTESAITQQHAQGMQQLLVSSLPGLIVSNRTVIGADKCPVWFYLDGFRLKDVDLDAITPAEIAGIELHSRVNAPNRYKPIGDYCSVVLLWTKWA